MGRRGGRVQTDERRVGRTEMGSTEEQALHELRKAQQSVKVGFEGESNPEQSKSKYTHLYVFVGGYLIYIFLIFIYFFSISWGIIKKFSFAG